MYPAGKFSKFLNSHKNLLTINLLWNVLKLNESTFSLFLGLTGILPIFFYEFSYDNWMKNGKTLGSIEVIFMPYVVHTVVSGHLGTVHMRHLGARYSSCLFQCLFVCLFISFVFPFCIYLLFILCDYFIIALKRHYHILFVYWLIVYVVFGLENFS